MKKDKNTDQLVTKWVESLLENPNQLITLPLSNHLQSPWGVNVMSDFLARKTSISIYEANYRKNLTLPLIEKMAEMGLIVKGASSTENLLRQKILHWYNTLNFEDKKCLPRLTTAPNNICFASIGIEQKSWVHLGTRYELIGKTLDEIHEDLYQLGIINSHFKKTKERKRLITDAKSAILEWVSEVIDDEDALWQIPISKANTPLGCNIAISHIQCTLGLSESAVIEHREFAYPLIEKMIKNGVLEIPDGQYEISAIENRRKLLNWYRQLSLEDKKLLPIFGNKISLGRMSVDQRPITRACLQFSLVKQAWNFIHQDLENLGVVNTNYKSVTERLEQRQISQEESSENQKERFNRLATKKLNTAADFIEPSKLDPFIQVEQLFASQSNTVPSESAKSNYLNACIQFLEYLSELYGYIPLRILEIFDEHILSKYRKYLEQKIINKKISSFYANTVLSSVRSALNRLTQVQDTGYSFFDVSGFSTNRETDFKKPFSKNERTQILNAIESGLEESKSKLLPYKRTGIGRSPLDKNGNRIKGLSSLENARWLFENLLDCKPIHYNTAQLATEKSFLKILSLSSKSLIEIYSEWGVTPMVSLDLLVPYLLKLAQVTGLNANSLLSLDIDDYEPSHPATSRPCLRYWKERSDGHKEYHLDLFNAQLTWLTSTQAKIVKEIFQDVMQLTKSLRQEVEDETIKKRLFIYQSNSRKMYGRVSPLLGINGKNTNILGENFARFVDKYGLKNDQGEPLTLTLSRFRPTFVSEMIDNGVSLREIQLMLGHSSIQTTIGYLDSLDFNSISRMKLNDKLKEIHRSTLDEKTKTLPEKVELEDTQKTIVTFHTPLAECKNIFDPPEFVKKLPSYIPGTPCSQYNKCLGCDNVIITAQNLPEIFAMRRDYTLLTQHTRVMDTPYGHVIQENLELIKSITEPELSSFSIQELENGQRLSEYIETTILVDGVV
ncbi:site-specific integrase [Acinetobacter indicus]|uniref:site-specific integrase n=1 Tax=Acinetobacter indicus TaxID=756892 RepID=UPI0014448DC9|nr:site-specific integrase [Acinetobacter indicus]